ncbi:hypothetical protein FB451DRAFT_1220830 [Mycena latifolia]|nr:hypothetical protein FB451DRAFT_1220830 [Mycena latifolia]
MPVFALAYGSVGDIIATVQLVTKLVTLLHRDSSQSSECAEKELKSLSSDVYLAFLTRVQTSESLIAKRIQDEVALCHQVMYRFFAMITAPKTFLQKLQWAVCQGKELAAFRTQVHERRMALNLVVNLINSRTLLAVQDRIDQVGGHVSDAHNMLRDVQDYVNGLTQQIAVYHEQVVADHVPHGVAEATFVVISPTGIPIPISVIFCSSYQDLDRIVKAYLHGRKEAGCCYVERGDYSIVSPKGDILRPPEFLTTLRDGIRLEMCIIKRDTARGWQKCPQCGHRSTGASSNVGWITCQNPSCGSRYRLNVDRSLPEQQARKTSSPPHQYVLFVRTKP